MRGSSKQDLRLVPRLPAVFSGAEDVSVSLMAFEEQEPLPPVGDAHYRAAASASAISLPGVFRALCLTNNLWWYCDHEAMQSSMENQRHIGLRAVTSLHPPITGQSWLSQHWWAWTRSLTQGKEGQTALQETWVKKDLHRETCFN